MLTKSTLASIATLASIVSTLAPTAGCQGPPGAHDDGLGEGPAEIATLLKPGGRYFDVVFTPPTAIHIVHSPDPNPVNPARQQMVTLTGGNIVLTRDVVYGTWPYRLAGGADVPLDFDVYQPDPAVDTELSRAAIMVVHGGGFVGGDKVDNNLADYCASFFAPRGWVCLSVNYRLGSSVDPDRAGIELSALADVQAALRYLRLNASTWHVDPARIAILGTSAGAILGADAAVAGENAATPAPVTNHDGDPHLTDTSSRVAMAVALSGAYSELVGPPVYDVDDAPVMFLHGDCDDTVFFAGAAATHDGLIGAGVPSWLVEYDGFGHCLGGVTKSDNQARLLPALWRCVIGAKCPASSYAFVDDFTVPSTCQISTTQASCHPGPSYPL